MIDFSPFSVLPPEVVVGNILTRCKAIDVVRFGLTSRAHAIIASDNLLWKELFFKAWPLTYSFIASKTENWQKAYQFQILQEKYLSQKIRKKSSFFREGKLFLSMHGNQAPVIYDNGRRIQYRRTDPPDLPHARLILPSLDFNEMTIIPLEKFPQLPTMELSQICYKTNQIAIGMFSGAIYLLTNKGKFLRHYTEHHKAITDLCIHENVLISASRDKTIKIWDKTQRGSTHTLTGHAEDVTSLAPFSHHLISGSIDKTVRIWSLNQDKALQTTLNQTSGVTCVQSLDSHLFASANLQGEISIYDGNKLERVQTLCLQANHAEQKIVKAMHWNPRTLITISADQTLKIWDYNQGKCIQTIPIREDNTHPDGLYIENDKIFIGHRSSYLNEINWELSTRQICLNKIKSCYTAIKKIIERIN